MSQVHLTQEHWFSRCKFPLYLPYIDISIDMLQLTDDFTSGLSEDNLIQSDAVLRGQTFESAHGSQEWLLSTIMGALRPAN